MTSISNLSSSSRLFGTDGIRGTVGSYPIIPEFFVRLGWALGTVLKSKKKEGPLRVLIGKDTRISGYMLESALESGLVASGAHIYLLGPMPTPAIGFLTRTMRADVGIALSASHNPYTDNGVKFFNHQGEKLPDADERMIECKALEDHAHVVASHLIGKVSRIPDAYGRYIEFCKNTFDDQDFKPRTLVVDCAHGATYRVAVPIFRELGFEVRAIGVNPDGLNINQEAGSMCPSVLVHHVLQTRSNMGIAFDGDGDRLLCVDHQGRILSGDHLLYLIARYYHEIHHIQTGVVGTYMSNQGLHDHLASLNIPFIRTQVGDRHVAHELRQQGWCLGGEPSGHLLCLNHLPSGDGIVAALQVLSALSRFHCDLSDIYDMVSLHPQYNCHIEDHPLMSLPVIQDIAYEIGEKFSCRILVRRSGTEPIIRMMVEGLDASIVQQCSTLLLENVHRYRQQLLS